MAPGPTCHGQVSIRFGKKTKLKVNLSDIVMIEKSTTAHVFDNAIKITLKDNLKIFLTSFIYRDDCFQTMWAVWELDRNKRGQTIEELQQSIAGIDSPEEVSDHEEEIKVDVGAN